jgi:hypothetical protein
MTLKTVKIASSARGIRRLLARARANNLILRAPDGREFILAEIDDFNREIELTRQNKALMKLLASRSKTTKRVAFAEVRKRLSITKQSAA